MVKQVKSECRDEILSRLASIEETNPEAEEVVLKVEAEPDPQQVIEEIEDKPHAVLRKSLRWILFLLAAVAAWRSADYVMSYYMLMANFWDSLKSAVLIVGSVFIIPELVIFLWDARLKLMSVLCAMVFIPLSYQTLSATMSGVYHQRTDTVMASGSGEKDTAKEDYNQLKKDQAKIESDIATNKAELDPLIASLSSLEIGTRDRGLVESRIRILKKEKGDLDKKYETLSEKIQKTSSVKNKEERKDFYAWTDERLGLNTGTSEFVALVSAGVAIDIAGPLFLTIAFNIRRLKNGGKNRGKLLQSDGGSLAPLRWSSMLKGWIGGKRKNIGVQASDIDRGSDKLG